MAASSVTSHRFSEIADAFPRRTTLSPTLCRALAKLSAPTLLKAVARTLVLGEMLRHWWTKPNPIAAATVVLPVPIEKKS